MKRIHALLAAAGLLAALSAWRAFTAPEEPAPGSRAPAPWLPLRAETGVGTFRLPPDLEARGERIDAELLNLGSAHPWAGSYYAGDHLGSNNFLSVAPEAGFVFVTSGCMGIYGLAAGTVHAREDGLELVAQSCTPGLLLPQRLVPIVCADGLFLVRPADLPAFRDASACDLDVLVEDHLLRDPEGALARFR